MNRRGLLIGLIVALVLAALIGWWLYTLSACRRKSICLCAARRATTRFSR